MLVDKGIFVLLVCGGGGICVQCKVIVKDGGGDILFIEESYFIFCEVKEGWCLFCQVLVKQDMKVELDEVFFGVKKWEILVCLNYNVVMFIKEFVLDLFEGEIVNFCVGGYVQLECLFYYVKYKDFIIEDDFCGDWECFGFFDLEFKVDEIVIWVYFMVNYFEEYGVLKFNIWIVMSFLGFYGMLFG